jgi:hypothetical protein
VGEAPGANWFEEALSLGGELCLEKTKPILGLIGYRHRKTHTAPNP